MKEVVEYLAKSLVDRPEAVRVTERRVRGQTVYLVEADPEDKGRLIGKKGRVIESIRVLVRAFARGRVNVEVR
ncbi:MAG TPA: KH domain-containing protein [Oceanithermus sp.]|nr:KH domain-containing protein [Oceanithermus sp.]